MTIWTSQYDGYRQDDDAPEFERFEKFSHRQQGDCPVRAHASRIRAPPEKSRRGGGPTEGAVVQRPESARPLSASGANLLIPFTGRFSLRLLSPLTLASTRRLIS